MASFSSLGSLIQNTSNSFVFDKSPFVIDDAVVVDSTALHKLACELKGVVALPVLWGGQLRLRFQEGHVLLQILSNGR